MRATWAVTGALGAAGAALGGLGLVIARRVTTPGGRRYDLTIRDVENAGERTVVVLDRTPRTTLPGQYSLFVENGERVRLSPVVEDRGPGLVAREVEGEPSAGLSTGAKASWSGIPFSTPDAAGLAAIDVEVPTEFGPAPAWQFLPPGGQSTTWAIHVHGLGGTRAGMLRGVPVMSEAGLTSLIVSYRNDGDGPVVGRGRSELGAAEMEDVRAAVRFAHDNGARTVVLVGWSMGAAIALQLAAETEFRGLIAGLVLESPVLDWVSTITANCARAGLPAWFGLLAVPWLDWWPLARITGLRRPIGLRRFDWIARADELSVLTLIVHGAADTSTAIAVSTCLHELRPDVVQFERFEADHTMTWNSDPQRWRHIVSTWLSERDAQLPDLRLR